jgi:hypothetical protein
LLIPCEFVVLALSISLYLAIQKGQEGMKAKILWVLAAVCLVTACSSSDDSSTNNANNSSGENNANNTNSQNNTNSNTANNSNNTDNNASNNSNNSSNNVSNNVNNTNNADMGTDMMGTLSCNEILQCLLGCDSGDVPCENNCVGQGTPLAQMQISNFLSCVDTNCAEAMGVTELTECTLTNCSDEQNACLGL